MQRIMGCILIIGATTGGGLLYGSELKQYLEKLLYIRHIIYLIKGELEYSRAPLGEIFGALSVRVREPYRTWMRALERKLEEREEQDFAKIWNRSIDQHLKELHLKTAHSIQLKELGTFLGQLDGDTMSRTMQLYLNRLELEIEKAREGMADKMRMGRWLGVMGGIFLIVILI